MTINRTLKTVISLIVFRIEMIRENSLKYLPVVLEHTNAQIIIEIITDFFNLLIIIRLRDHLRTEEGRTILIPIVKEIFVEIFFMFYAGQLHLA